MLEAGVALGIAALVAAVAGWFPWIRGHVSAPAFVAAIHKLLDRGDVDRAAKLCGAAPHSPLARAVRAAIAAGREAGGTDDEREQAIGATYDQTVVAGLDRQRAAHWLMAGGIGLAAVAINARLEAGAGGAAALWPALALVPAVHGWRLSGGLARAADAERPALVAAIARATAPPAAA